MRILELIRHFRRRFSSYQPLVKVIIYKNRLLGNLRVFQKTVPHLAIAPVLKSNAYGHGLVPVAKILDRQPIAFFAVDSPFEAIEMRRAGIKSKILVIGYASAETIRGQRLKNVSFTVTSLEHLRQIAGLAKKTVRLHVKIDTGMRRQGIVPGDIAEAILVLKKSPRLIVEGLCSHLADPGSEKRTLNQQNAWEKAVQIFTKAFPKLQYRHLSASAGYKNAGSTDNVLRLGIGLYGFSDLPGILPALEMQTIVTGLRALQKGECVGYDYDFIAPSDLEVATVPVGYYEGVDRRLSNRGTVYVNNRPCPIVGRVSMNITSINVSRAQAKLGEAAVIISSDSERENSVANIAKQAGTIPYEILVHIPAHLRRVVL